ncbi:hypothetical protein SOASR032_23260 [Pragia fontium]|uniref:4'-phosphopantetheinyl transferase domain-containing protein n=1 Tax=Pragia fontium TaxID=82985 RepID=A0ABQ5LLK8_9GAMM|nr:4'-phosphopantetheinyl transferase superfamily protein [Pragia fontium]GKX63757.1 hypothetical protein SOASR032_23260 [Pragia fontium]
MVKPTLLSDIAIATLRLPSTEWLPGDLSRIPMTIQQQSEQFNPKRRQQFLSGRWLLAELIFNQLGWAQLPDITISDNGRPSFISAERLDFNISHSGEYIMVALAQGGRIGLDVEHIRPRKKLLALAAYSFSEDEYQWLLSLPESCQADGFWQLWTLRESVLKLSAKGVWQMKQIRIHPQQKQVSADFQPELVGFTSRYDDIAWAIASEQNIAQIHYWNIDQKTEQLIPADLPELSQFSGR